MTVIQNISTATCVPHIGEKIVRTSRHFMSVYAPTTTNNPNAAVEIEIILTISGIILLF